MAAETFCFWDKTNQALYFRISVVIQCLIKADRKMTLNREQYTRYLHDILRSELKILADEFPYFPNCEDMPLENVSGYIKNFLNHPELNSTQKWILRVYDQRINIILYLSDVYTVAEEKVWSEIWKDITSDVSYLANQDKLYRTLEKNGGSELCKGIISVDARWRRNCERNIILQKIIISWIKNPELQWNGWRLCSITVSKRGCLTGLSR